MPVNIAQTTFLNSAMMAIAETTATVTLTSLVINIEATSAAITETASPSKNRSTFGLGAIQDINTAPAIRVPKTTAEIMATAKMKEASLSMRQNADPATDNRRDDDVPSHRQ